MRIFAILVMGAIAAGATAPAHAASPACQASLQALSAEWNSIAYPTPSKPSQFRVYGAGGHSNSGPEISYMRGQIHQAAMDCEAGNDVSATTHIAAVHSLLDPPGRSQQ